MLTLLGQPVGRKTSFSSVVARSRSSASGLRGDFQIGVVSELLRFGFMMIGLPGWPEGLMSVRWIDDLGSASMMAVWSVCWVVKGM